MEKTRKESHFETSALEAFHWNWNFDAITHVKLEKKTLDYKKAVSKPMFIYVMTNIVKMGFGPVNIRWIVTECAI